MDNQIEPGVKISTLTTGGLMQALGKVDTHLRARAATRTPGVART